jgi:hypothetical protein
MPHRTPLPEELCGAAFTVARARQLQVGRGRLASRDLFRPFHGIRTGEAPVGVLARCRAYQAKLGSNMSFSHLTAAVVLGIPLMWGLEKLDVLHVTTFGGRPARGRGITGHKSSRSMLPYTVGDVRVTDPVQTFFDLATMVSHKWLVVAGDALVGGEHPLCTLEELRTAVTLRAGARGTERARRALMRVRLRVDSPMETLLRLLLVDAGLIEPIVNRRYWARRTSATRNGASRSNTRGSSIAWIRIDLPKTSDGARDSRVPNGPSSVLRSLACWSILARFYESCAGILRRNSGGSRTGSSSPCRCPAQSSAGRGSGALVVLRPPDWQVAVPWFCGRRQGGRWFCGRQPDVGGESAQMHGSGAQLNAFRRPRALALKAWARRRGPHCRGGVSGGSRLPA